MARGRERRYLGHNLAVAAMIVALLVALSATAFTGWLMEEPGRLAMLPVLPQVVAPTHADDAGDDGEYGEMEGIVQLAERMIWHETIDTEILYPAAALVAHTAQASMVEAASPAALRP
jgi:cytochrome b